MQDVEEDPSGRLAIPTIGSIITRNGRQWKVIRVHAPIAQSGATPIVRLFLSDRVAQPSLGARRKIP